MSTSEKASRVDLHPNFNKSHLVNSILHGCEDPQSSHFADQLQRFKRDFASYHKQEKENIQNKKNGTVAKKQEQRQNFLHTLHVRDEEVEKKKEIRNMTNLHLFDIGQKRNGMTSGIPVNPINHAYQNTYGGKQLQKNENQKHMSSLVRLHHLQTKNCGYNLLNGQANAPVQTLVKPEEEQMMNSRIETYKEYYRIRPPYF